MKYWNRQGRFQLLLDKLWKKLVPTHGKANTEHAEFLRIVGKCYYDICNNGGCNYDFLYDRRAWAIDYAEENNIRTREISHMLLNKREWDCHLVEEAVSQTVCFVAAMDMEEKLEKKNEASSRLASKGVGRGKGRVEEV